MGMLPIALVVALAASVPAWSEALDPPERIAHLSYVEGPIEFAGAQEPVRSTLPERPLAPGDRFVTGRGARAELSLGTAAIRLDERTELTLAALEATTVRAELTAGTASVTLRDLLEGETFEIETPTTTIALQGPGEYRVAVAARETTEITVRGGQAEVATAGSVVRVADGQRVRLEGPEAFASLAAPASADDFDDWVEARELRFANAQATDEELREGAGYDELDRYGEWYDEPRYGRVWMPSYGYAGWSPFRYGYWEPIGYRRYTWIDPAPWGAFTFYHGRWAFLHHINRWCWVPERHHHRRDVVPDTRPFGHPRVDRDERPRDLRSQGDGEDVLRRVLWRTDPKKERRPVVTPAREPLRFDADRRPAFRSDVSPGKRPPAGTLVPSRSRDQGSPQRASSAPRGGGETTMRASTARSPSTTRPDAGTSRTTFGARYNER